MFQSRIFTFCFVDLVILLFSFFFFGGGGGGGGSIFVLVWIIRTCCT